MKEKVNEFIANICKQIEEDIRPHFRKGWRKKPKKGPINVVERFVGEKEKYLVLGKTDSLSGKI